MATEGFSSMNISSEDAKQAETLADSNMANYGSKEHRELRRKAAEAETAWKEITQEPGLLVWRIEKFKVKKWPKSKYGQFHEGDSYIILNTYLDEEGATKYNVHFWLGSETTQDEAGAAAYKTVEIDDYLGDLPVQYREVQGIESKEFLDLFDKIGYLEGGVATGFRHVEKTVYPLRLFQIRQYAKKAVKRKGQPKVRISPVPVSGASLNNGDVFVLDAGLEIFMWRGSNSRQIFERVEGQNLVQKIEGARAGKARKFILEPPWEDDDSARFWKYLGGRPDSIPEEEVSQETETSVMRVTDASGTVKFTDERKGPVSYSYLDPNDVYFIDKGDRAYVWIGKGSTGAERSEAMRYATMRLKESGRDQCVPIQRITSGSEPKSFLAILQEE